MTEPTLKQRLTGAGFEIGTGIGTDAVTTALLLNPATLLKTGGISGVAYAGINGFQGALSNYIAQKHIYGEDNIRWGEIIASGALNMIPWMDLQAGKNVAKVVGDASTFKRGIVGGAAYGLAGEQLRVGIDEKRPLSLTEAAATLGMGAGFGAGFTGASKGIQKGVKKWKAKRLQKNQPKFDPAANQRKMDEAIEIAKKLGKDPEDYLVEQGLKHRLSLSLSSEDYQPRAAAINTVNTNIKGVAAKLNHTAIELGYEPPSADAAFINKLIEEGYEPPSGMIKLRKSPKAHPNIPDDVYTLYTAHQAAYWDHIQKVQIRTPGAKIDMRSFPDLIHDGITYRPDPHYYTIKEGPDAGTKILTWTGVKDRNERMSKSNKGRTKRLDQLKELNTYSGSSTGRWLRSKKSLVDELNDKLVAEGKHPIGELESIPASDLHGDHRFPVDFTQKFGAGLSDKYKRIVYGHIVRAGGFLGDEIDNVVILNKAINIRKQSKLKALFKRRKKYASHRSAQSFGEFDPDDLKSLQKAAEQRARVEYYTTPRKETGLTPIEEFVEDVYMAEQWAEEQMDSLLDSLERIFPEELDNLPPEKRKIILEIFGGKWKDVKTFVGRLREWEAEGMKPRMIQEMIDDEIWSRLSGLFK